MRKSKIIKIDNEEITVKELRVRDIYELFSMDDAPLAERLDDLLSRCSDMDRDALINMTPSDLKTLWDGFAEVNAAFLEFAALAGLDDLPEMFRKNLRMQFAPSLPPDTGQ